MSDSAEPQEILEERIRKEPMSVIGGFPNDGTLGIEEDEIKDYFNSTKNAGIRRITKEIL